MLSISVLSPLVTAISEQSGVHSYLIGQGPTRVLLSTSSHVDELSTLHRYLQVTGIYITKALDLTKNTSSKQELINVNKNIDLIAYKNCFVLLQENSVFSNANESIDTLIQAAIMTDSNNVRFYFGQNQSYKTVELNNFVVSKNIEASL